MDNMVSREKERQISEPQNATTTTQDEDYQKPVGVL